MNYRKLGLGLSAFSVGLRLFELLSPGRLARWLGVDGMDFAAPEPAFSRSNLRPALGKTFALVVGVTLIDIIAARGLAEETGRTFPRSARPAGPCSF